MNIALSLLPLPPATRHQSLIYLAHIGKIFFLHDAGDHEKPSWWPSNSGLWTCIWSSTQVTIWLADSYTRFLKVNTSLLPEFCFWLQMLLIQVKMNSYGLHWRLCIPYTLPSRRRPVRRQLNGFSMNMDHSYLLKVLTLNPWWGFLIYVSQLFRSPSAPSCLEITQHKKAPMLMLGGFLSRWTPFNKFLLWSTLLWVWVWAWGCDLVTQYNLPWVHASTLWIHTFSIIETCTLVPLDRFLLSHLYDRCLGHLLVALSVEWMPQPFIYLLIWQVSPWSLYGPICALILQLPGPHLVLEQTTSQIHYSMPSITIPLVAYLNLLRFCW